MKKEIFILLFSKSTEKRGGKMTGFAGSSIVE